MVERTIVKNVLICLSVSPTVLSVPIQVLMAERTPALLLMYPESR